MILLYKLFLLYIHNKGITKDILMNSKLLDLSNISRTKVSWIQGLCYYDSVKY